MTYAVAILNYNGSILLRKFISKVVKNCSDAVIYLVDNKSKSIIQKFIGPLDDEAFAKLTKIIQ